MNKRFSLWIFVLALLCIAMLSACEPTPPSPVPQETFSVTAEFNSEGGTVSITPPASEDGYVEGESVTVTVTPVEGFVVVAFAVSDHADARLEQGEFTFTVTADTVITVEFASEEPPAPQFFTVTLSNYDRAYGSARITPPANAAGYAAGESVTVTAIPAEGCEVTVFEVSTEPNAALSNGAYTFAVTDNATVTVVFSRQVDNVALLADALQQLGGSVLFQADYLEENITTGERSSSLYKTYFDVATRASLFETYLGDQIYSTMLLADSDGFAAIVTHDEFGKTVLDASEDPFDEFDNPFVGLTADDFVNIGAGRWTVAAELANAIVATITTYNENVTSFVLTNNDGYVTITVDTHRVVGADDNSVEIYATYDIAVEPLEDGALAPRLADYEETSEHVKLRQALEQAAQADSYTVIHHKEEVGEPDVDFNTYVTPDGIYEDLVGWENGYVERPDGNVWQYFWDDESQDFRFLNDFYKNVTIDDLGAVFVVQEASLSLLEYRGDGVFAMRFEDTVLDGYYSLFPGYFAQYFAVGVDEPRYFPTAISFEIELRNDILYRVRFVYSYYGYISEDVTLIFDHWNETVLPITLEPEFIAGTVSGDMCGNWADDSFAYALTVTPDSVTLNGDPAADLVALSGGRFGFNVAGNAYTMQLEGETLILQRGSTITYLHKTQCPWMDFLGVYSGADGNDVPYSVVIGESSLTLFVDGSVTAITEFEYGFEFSQQSEVYIYTFDFEYNGVPAFLYLNANQSNQFIYGEDHDDDALDKTVVLTIAECRWDKFLGAYEGSKNNVDYRVVIAPYGIYIYADDQMYTTQITRYDSYEGFEFTVDGFEEQLCIGQDGYTQEVNAIGLYVDEGRYINRYVELKRVTNGGVVHPTEELFKPEFWGTWISEDGTVTMVITANSLTINGESVSAAYDGMNGYQIKWGIYIAMERAIWRPTEQLVISSADYQEIYFNRVA